MNTIVATGVDYLVYLALVATVSLIVYFAAMFALWPLIGERRALNATWLVCGLSIVVTSWGLSAALILAKPKLQATLCGENSVPLLKNGWPCR